MWRIPLAVVVLAISVPQSVSAQQWIDFESREDRFSCNFPGQPTITDTTFTSQFGAELPARVYDVTLGPSHRFTMTVVDYGDIEAILAEKAESCPEGAETCRGGSGAPGNSTGPGYSKADRQGAITYATWLFMQRDAVVTHLLWTNINLIEGHLIQLTNADDSRTGASIFMYFDKLYVMEGTTPAGSPEPGLFYQSLAFLDEDGSSLRYASFYRNGFPEPPQTR